MDGFVMSITLKRSPVEGMEKGKMTSRGEHYISMHHIDCYCIKGLY